MRTSIVVASLMALAACGGTGPGSGSPGNGSSGTPDPPWWGLGNALCLHYADPSGGPAQFELEIHTSQKFSGVTTYDVLEHFNLFPGTERWFQVTGDELLLRGLSDQENGSGCPNPNQSCITYTTYDPPPVYLKNDLAQGASVETTTTASVSGARSGKFQQRFTVAAFPPETLKLAIGGKQVQATKYTVTIEESGQPSKVDRVWLVPKIGFAQVEFSQENIQEFQSSQTLQSGEACGL